MRVADADLVAIAAIGRGYQATDIEAVGHFHAGDAHLKDGDFGGALPHYAAAFQHAPTVGLRARSLAGRAIALANLRRPEDRRLFWSIRGQITDLLAEEAPEGPAAYLWDSEGWLLASLWSEATLARSLVILGERREAEPAIERLCRRYENARAQGFAHAPFAMSLAQLRFLAACKGVFDTDDRDIRELGREAHRLADDGNCIRTRREVEGMMASRFGAQAWL